MEKLAALAKEEMSGLDKVQCPLFSVGACSDNCKENYTKTDLADHLKEMGKNAHENTFVALVEQINTLKGQLTERDDIIAKLQADAVIKAMPQKRSRKSSSAAAALAATDISLLNPNSDSDTSGDEATYTIMNQTGATPAKKAKHSHATTPATAERVMPKSTTKIQKTGDNTAIVTTLTSTYEGEVNEDGLKHGQGTLTTNSGYAHGNSYSGEFLNDKRHGYGTSTFKGNTCFGRPYAGGVYEGEWKDDKKHGYGKLTYENGDIYEGHWGCGGKMHGQGKFTYADGSTMDAVFRNGVKHGPIVMIAADGTRTEERWKMGERIA